MSTSEILTIGRIIGKTVPYLKEKKIPNPRLEADLLLAKVLALSRVQIYSQWDRPLEKREIQHYRELLIKRVQGWPLAYLTESKGFLGWEFRVNPAVLIPRPETEMVVELAYEQVKTRPQLRGVEVGTGSGALVISLAKLLPQSQWRAIDISPEALAVARENAALLGVAEQIEFLEGDLLAPLEQEMEGFDLIISNPPYIPSAQIVTLQPEVRKEPRMALDGGEDGFAIYRRLFPQAARLLAPEGRLIVEHGYEQREGLQEMLSSLGMVYKGYQDLAGWDRIIMASRE